MVGHMYGCRIRPPATPLGKSTMVVDCTSPNVRPPNSPDHNPMDYYVWGTVEKDANRRASTTKVQLIDRIKAAFETLPKESVASACSRFRGRIGAVIDANGGYFE